MRLCELRGPCGWPTFPDLRASLRLDPKKYTGASVRFFALVNAIKVIPYVALGALDMRNFSTSLTLLPVALLATFAGAMIVRRLKRMSSIHSPMGLDLPHP